MADNSVVVAEQIVPETSAVEALGWAPLSAAEGDISQETRDRSRISATTQSEKPKSSPAALVSRSLLEGQMLDQHFCPESIGQSWSSISKLSLPNRTDVLPVTEHP